MAFTLDSFRGGFSALMVGDALGAPYEFYADRNRVYAGAMTLEPRIYNRVTKQFRSGVPGQITDDSEMTMATLRVLASGGTRENFIEAYLEWANSNTSFLGRNTRSLFKGIKTVRGYESRALKNGLQSESNGTLMRALPFVFFGGVDAAIENSQLTNDNEMTRLVIGTYVKIVRGLLTKEIDVSQVKQFAKEEGFDIDQPKFVLEGGFRGKEKGWVAYPLVCLINSLINYPVSVESLPLIANEVINDYRGCDTDTVLSIVYGVFGSSIGHRALVKNEWFRNHLQTTLDCDTSQGQYPREEKFWASTFYGELKELWSET